MNTLDISKFDCISLHQHIREVCQPLKLLNIDYFALHRIFNEKERVVYCTHPEWIEYYYLNRYFQANVHDVNNMSTGFIHWSCYKKPVFEVIRHYNIENGLTFVREKKRYVDFYSFATVFGSECNQARLTANIPLLERFINYFSDRLHDLIEKTQKAKVVLPKSTDFITNYGKNKQKEEFLKKTKINRFYINEIYLTKREIECLFFISKGKSDKEIASLLDISNHTVEAYIKKIKKKLHCETRSKLILRAAQEHLLENICQNIDVNSY